MGRSKTFVSNTFKLKDNTLGVLPQEKVDTKISKDPWQMKSFIPAPVGIQKDGIQKNNYNAQTSKFLAKGSKYEKFLSECKTTNKQFVDKEFPPNNKSILGFENKSQIEDIDMKVFKKMGWKTLKQMFKYNQENELEQCETYDICKGGIIFFLKILGFKIDDINQGMIGNCFFLAAASAVCMIEELVNRIFLTKDMSKYEIYCIALFVNGVWEPFVLDGRFPVSLLKPKI